MGVAVRLSRPSSSWIDKPAAISGLQSFSEVLSTVFHRIRLWTTRYICIPRVRGNLECSQTERMAEVDPDTLLEWLALGSGDDRDIQLLALEQLCMLLLMSDNVDKCFEAYV